MQREAYLAQDAVEAAEKAIMASAEEVKLIAQQEALQEMMAIKAEVRDRLNKLRTGSPIEIQKILRESGVTRQDGIKALEAKMKELDVQSKTMRDLLSKDTNAPSSWIASTWIGVLTGISHMGGIVGLTAGMALPATQRTLAGQTAIQQWLQRLSQALPDAQYGATSLFAGDEPLQRKRSAVAVTGDDERLANMYIALQRSGRLGEFEKAQPKLFEKVEKAYKKLYK